jgi:hypothetical protein
MTSIVCFNSFSYPLSYVNPTVISASAYTPSTTFAVPLYSTIPTVPTISTISTISSASLANTIMSPIMPSILPVQDVNADKNLRRQVTNYFYDKVSQNWVKYSYLELYNYFTVNNGEVSLIKNIKDAETNTKNDPVENAIKYTFIVKNYITKNDVYKLLSNYRKEHRCNWWDLKKLSSSVKRYIFSNINEYILDEIASQSK